MVLDLEYNGKCIITGNQLHIKNVFGRSCSERTLSYGHSLPRRQKPWAKRRWSLKRSSLLQKLKFSSSGSLSKWHCRSIRRRGRNRKKGWAEKPLALNHESLVISPLYQIVSLVCSPNQKKPVRWDSPSTSHTGYLEVNLCFSVCYKTPQARERWIVPH